MSSPIQQSPGVLIKEIDLTNFVPFNGISGGGTVGQFNWGPVEQVTTISDVNQLITMFHKPTDTNFIEWFGAYNFLSYTNNLKLVRVVTEQPTGQSIASTYAYNAAAVPEEVTGSGVLIKNEDHYQHVATSLASGGYEFAARYPGAMGNSIGVSMADSASYSTWAYKNSFDFEPGTSAHAAGVGAVDDEVHIVILDTLGLFTGVPGAILEKFAFLSKASDAKSLDGEPIFYGNVLNSTSKYVWYLGIPGVDNVLASRSTGTVASVTVGNGGSGYTTPTVTFSAPGGTGVTATGTAVVETGVITGITITNPGSGYTSTPTITITDGAGTGASATAVMGTKNTEAWAQTVQTSAGVGRSFKVLDGDYTVTLSAGTDGATITSDEAIIGWGLFRDKESVDVALLFTNDGCSESDQDTVNQYVIDNVVEHRKDCVMFCSPALTDVLNKTQSDAQTAVLARRDSLGRSSNYAVMDSGWKLQYDQFNDKYRWIPLNADIAGLCAATDATNDPWWSPAGLNRGKIKNVVSLAFNPNQTARDELYKKCVNPVTTFSGEGTVLFGDKTLQYKPSAFQWINVRRLFLVLEKNISRAAKYYLFEFNDEFTRAQFRNMVEPFLREVQGRRGIYDFRVVCDSSNNTGEVIDRGEFVASIFIKPARSINWITLNFVAVKTGVEFEEVLGAV